MNPADPFRQDSDTLTLAPGEVLFRTGDIGKEMFVLIDGSEDILVGDKVVEVATPGALVGEMAMIEEGPRTASVVAKDQCKLARNARPTSAAIETGLRGCAKLVGFR